jgi:hypothetical protein
LVAAPPSEEDLFFLFSPVRRSPQKSSRQKLVNFTGSQRRFIAIIPSRPRRPILQAIDPTNRLTRRGFGGTRNEREFSFLILCPPSRRAREVLLRLFCVSTANRLLRLLSSHIIIDNNINYNNPHHIIAAYYYQDTITL